MKVILFARFIPTFVKNALNLLAMSSLFVISVLFMLISVGKLFLLPFLEIISFIVFHVFLISDLYLAKVDARNCCLAARI